MNVLSWLALPPARPVLLRLHLREIPCPSAVEVVARWSPGETTVRSTLISSSSMVLMPWRGELKGASIEVRIGTQVGRAQVTRRSNRDGTAIDVWMNDEATSAEHADGTGPRPALPSAGAQAPRPSAKVGKPHA